MAVKSVYWPRPDSVGDTVAVKGEEHRHLRVSRARPGERVELFDGAGRVWDGEVVALDRRRTIVRITGERGVPPPEVDIVLGQSLVRNAAFELALEKAVEVGVTRIVPVRSGRSTDTGGVRHERWQKIIVEAAKQSKHYHLPRLDPVTAFEDLMEFDAPSKAIFAERSDGTLEAAVRAAPVLYLIGPEGGWGDQELQLAETSGFRSVGLGPHILRAETAAIVAGGLIAHQLGVLG